MSKSIKPIASIINASLILPIKAEVHYNSELEEYRVSLYHMMQDGRGYREEADYFTGDLIDARDTAWRMVGL